MNSERKREPARMKQRHETEIKLEVRNPRATKQRLAELGFRRVTRRHFESNFLFDFPDLRLRKARCLLRVRLAGGHSLLTFKGTPLRCREFKIRREIETGVADGHQMREMLTCLGLCEVFRYEKYRTIYAPPDKRTASPAAHVLYDETPIGNYLEIEGSRRWIDQVARQLGYARRDYITVSYGTLYRRWCQARDREPANMVFAGHKT